MRSLILPASDEVPVSDGWTHPDGVRLANGNYVLSWLSFVGSNRTFMQIYAPDGSAIGDPVILNAANSNHSIAALDKGGFVIAFATSTTSGYAQVFSPAGAAVSDAISVGDAWNVEVAALSGGRFALSNFMDAPRLVTVHDTSGLQVATIAPAFGAEPTAVKILELANGSIVASWLEVDMVTPLNQPWGDGYDLYHQLLAADGTPLSSPTMVNDTRTGSYHDQSLTALADGGYVIVFDGSDRGLLAQVFDSTGEPLSALLQLDEQLTGQPYLSDVDALSWGGFVVTWLDHDSEHIRMRLFDSDGTPIGDSLQVDTGPPRSFHYQAETVVVTDDLATVFYTTGGPDIQNVQKLMRLPVAGTTEDDDLSGSSDDDSIIGRDGNDVINGLAGDDLIVGGRGADELHGGDGGDELHGGEDDDELHGEGGNDTLYGDAGDDTIIGGEGNDWIVGGLGSDTLAGGDGRDTFAGLSGDFAGDVLTDFAIGDRIVITDADPSSFSAIWDEDRLTFGNATLTLTGLRDVPLAATIAPEGGVAIYIPAQRLVLGTDMGQQLRGSLGDDIILGRGGSDVIFGSDGFDYLDGGSDKGDLLYFHVGLFGDSTTYFDSNSYYLTSNRIYDTNEHVNTFYTGFEVVGLILAGLDGNFLIDASAWSPIGAKALTIQGGNSDDILIGSAYADEISASGGADLLTGGGGIDTFRGQAVEFAGDTITDLAPKERILITDADAVSFSFDRNGDAISFGNSTLTVTGSASKRLVWQVSASGGVELFFDHTQTAHDYTGDSVADLLWRNADGTVTYWEGTGSGFNGATGFHLANGTNWDVAGDGDLTGDGRADILWRSDTGALAYWQSSGNGFDGANSYHQPVGTDWQVAGMGDLDGDGKDDIVWRHDAGTLAAWLSTGSGFNGAAWGSVVVGNEWHVDGVGDVNGDGRDDLVWRGDNGAITVWTSTGSGFEGSFAVEFVSADWHIAGIDDFNGDGMDDVLWRGEGGGVTVWTGNGGGFDGGSYGVELVDPNWSVAATGDYNGDGLSDILWRHTDGGLTYWAGTGTSFNGATGIFEHVNPSWVVFGG